MKNVLFFLYMGSLLFSAIMAIIYRNHIKGRRLSIMVPYLLMVFIMETGLAWYLYIQKSSTFVYNIYKPLSLVVFAIVYYSIPFMFRFRKVIIGVVGLYLVTVIMTYLFFDSILTSNTYLTLVRGFCITFFAIFFLFSYFHLDNLAEEKYWRPLIWLTIGVIAFYPVTSISLGFYEYLRDLKATLSGLKLYQAIPQLMSIFMYSCFSYAFYLCQKKN